MNTVAAQRLLHELSLLTYVAGPELMSHYMDLGALTIRSGGNLEALRAEVEGVVNAGFNPTLEDFAALRARREALEKQIAEVGK
jgi:hypothetical protein